MEKFFKKKVLLPVPLPCGSLFVMFNIKTLLRFFDFSFVKKNLLLVLLFALIPFGELLFILYVGEQLGRYLVFAMAVSTGLIGYFMSLNLIRKMIKGIRSKIKKDIYPGGELLGLAGAVFASLMVITPGFITDIFGLLIFVPGIRRAVGSIIVFRFEIQLKELYEYLKLYEL